MSHVLVSQLLGGGLREMVGLNERGDEIKYSGYYRRGGSVRGGG